MDRHPDAQYFLVRFWLVEEASSAGSRDLKVHQIEVVDPEPLSVARRTEIEEFVAEHLRRWGIEPSDREGAAGFDAFVAVRVSSLGPTDLSILTQVELCAGPIRR